MFGNSRPKPEDIFLIKGTKNDEPLWYYIRVEKNKQPLLKKLTAIEGIEPEQLGKIIYWGIGEEPPLYYREKVEKGEF